MWFWSSALQTASKLESLRQAELRLLKIAQAYGGNIGGSFQQSTYECDIQVVDTGISRSSVPLKPLSSWRMTSSTCESSMEIGDEEDQLIIHGVQVTSKNQEDPNNSTDTPLVILHGYMNAGAYFYRNFAGLGQYYRSIFSLDLLGWGLSSRPSFHQLKDNTIETAESFFVDSLESWREKNNIDKMILAGHSMGGYISVAYCERYPHRVERLLLLSPVGVPDENDPSFQQRKKRLQSSFQARAFLGLFQTLFEWTTVGSVLRSLPESKAYDMSRNYIDRRLPEISDKQEQEALADFLFYNTTLPGSGEYAINRFLNSNILAKKPLKDRIPRLQVKDVHFLYGSHDWMDISGGLTTKRACDGKPGTPNVQVYMVPNAGHLLMLQNWKMTNAGMIHAGGGKVHPDEMPIVLHPGEEDLPDSLLRELAAARSGQQGSPQIVV